ncbi:hypothetical protein COCON_G00095120 [Conger conger]|uniref:N-alpha-acetyltransferase 30 n=1 Tax=Conger conger TaxID=82655 RepID=A0A9Q1DLS7_CONCO|nr:uncharacterized protein LOC133128629 [Conger conger]KAJ8274887.1 hypothetical protein COCON_G00095120 [Conger conger]
MAELPPGPSSALSASPAEIIPFTGVGCTVSGERDERDCGRRDTVIPVVGLQQQVSAGKGTHKTTPNHLFSHSPGPLFSTQPQQQQINGIPNSTEDGLQLSNLSHLHHRAHRQPDNKRGGSGEHCDGSCEAEEPAPQNNNLSDKNNSDSRQEHNQCSKNKCSHSNNNCINSMLTLSRTESNCGRLVNEVDGTGYHARTEPRPSPGDPPDGDSLGMQLSGGASDTSHVPVVEMERLDLNSFTDRGEEEDDAIQYARYESELQMPDIMRLITKDLSEPYSIYTYRYFIHNWPQLCFLAMVRQECVGAIVCKLDMHKKMFRRGYIAMLAVDSKYRRKSIGTNLVKKAIYAMVEGDCDEVVLETEITNKPALKLYENLGFVRDKRLFRYYLNGVDALRLKLWLR